jgi:hypothetical protein
MTNVTVVRMLPGAVALSGGAVVAAGFDADDNRV